MLIVVSRDPTSREVTYYTQAPDVYNTASFRLPKCLCDALDVEAHQIARASLREGAALPPPSRRATQPHRISSDLERAAPALSCPRRAASAEAQVQRA